MNVEEAFQTIRDQGAAELAQQGTMDWELVDQAMAVCLKNAGVTLADFRGILSDKSARAWFPEQNRLTEETHFPIVYFISTDNGALVKIGTTKHLRSRLAALISTMPTEVRFEAALPGSFPQERELHSRFAESRVRGEWFERTDELSALIRSCQLAHPDLNP